MKSSNLVQNIKDDMSIENENESERKILTLLDYIYDEILVKKPKDVLNFIHYELFSEDNRAILVDIINKGK